MENNFFMDAMSADKVLEFETIKRNKAFALTLHDHLNKIYYTNHRISDSTGSVEICMRTSERNNFYGSYGFNATKDGVTFFMWNKLILYPEKFNETHNGFLNKLLEHPKSRNYTGSSYELHMDINEDDVDLNKKLNFILAMMEGKYNKRF